MDVEGTAAAPQEEQAPQSLIFGNSVNTEDLENYVIEELEESEGETNPIEVDKLADVP